MAQGVSPSFAYYPTSSGLKRSSFGFSASSFALSLRDGVTLPGRVCLSPRLERRLLLHLPGVWLGSSRWVHPVGSGFVPDLDRNEDFLAHLPSWLVSCLRDGVTHFRSSGAFRRPRSERRLLPFIYPWLLRDGVTLRVECVVSRTRSYRSRLWLAVWYSFRMGSPSRVWIFDLISIEGIATFGLLRAVRLYLGVALCLPLVVRSAL